MFSADGLMPEGGPQQVQRLAAQVNRPQRERRLDLGRTFTNDFVQANTPGALAASGEGREAHARATVTRPCGPSPSCTRPAWAWAISRTMARPRPQPSDCWLSSLKKRSNTRSRSAGAMPGPLSSTSSSTCPGARAGAA
jgi:hypothetical protein